MTNKADIISNPAVTSTNDWTKGNHDRTYLHLAGYSDRHRGDKSCQVYWDNSADELVIRHGKGMTSDAFDASIAALEEL